jgi:hypothetical protein
LAEQTTFIFVVSPRLCRWGFSRTTLSDEKPCICIMCDQRLKDAKQNATSLQQRTPKQWWQQHQKGLQDLVPPPPLVALFSKQRQQSSSTSATVALGHSSASTRTPAPATSRNPRSLHNSQHRALETLTASDSKWRGWQITVWNRTTSDRFCDRTGMYDSTHIPVQ